MMQRQTASRMLLGLLIGLMITGHGSSDDAADGRPRPKADDRQINELEGQAIKCRTSQAALDKYEAFLTFYSVTPRQQTLIDSRLKTWNQRHADGLVRVGATWMTPAAAREIGKKADDLITEAFERITAGKFGEAKDLLERAERTDPSGVRADYLLGLLNSPNLWNYAPAAEKYFQIAQKRDPDNVALLNNLAISKVKMGKFSEALDLWTAALRMNREMPEVTQNLGRFVLEGSEKRLTITKAHLERATKLHDKAVAEHKGPASDLRTGWLYSRIVLPIDEQQRTELKESSSQEDEAAGSDTRSVSVYLGQGTGFVVHPHFILTNWHVVDDATFLRIVDPRDPRKEHDATLVAKAAGGLDLALVQCNSLEADPVPLRRGLPRRSTEIMLLGFPLAEKVGESLKSTRGQITGLPNETLKFILIDATVNPGNSGGPILDRAGNAIAVCTIKTAIGGGVNDNYGGGLPCEWAWPMLEKSIPGFVSEPSEEMLEWPDVDERVSRSTVMVKSYGVTVPFVARVPERKVLNLFEDRTCVMCKGRRQVACPIKGCTRGSVTEFEESWQVQAIGHNSQVLKSMKPRSKSCPGCRGAGIVDCPACRDGTDPRLK